MQGKPVDCRLQGIEGEGVMVRLAVVQLASKLAPSRVSRVEIMEERSEGHAVELHEVAPDVSLSQHVEYAPLPERLHRFRHIVLSEAEHGIFRHLRRSFAALEPYSPAALFGRNGHSHFLHCPRESLPVRAFLDTRRRIDDGGAATLRNNPHAFLLPCHGEYGVGGKQRAGGKQFLLGHLCNLVTFLPESLACEMQDEPVVLHRVGGETPCSVYQCCLGHFSSFLVLGLRFLG